MKREKLSIFYSLWLRCFVVMLQYAGFSGRSQLFGSQVKVGAPTQQLARQVGARQVRFWRAPTPPFFLFVCTPCPLPPSCIPFAFQASHHFIILMPAKQPKKGKGKKVTVVTGPTSSPANPEVQAVLDAHIANVGSEHFPAGYFPIPYTLTPLDAESFPSSSPAAKPWRPPSSASGTSRAIPTWSGELTPPASTSP